MSAHDDNVKKLLTLVETKRNKLGDKPVGKWVTNGLWKYQGTSTNINTLVNVADCVDIVAQIIKEKGSREEAAKLLEVNLAEFTIGGFNLNSWVQDFKVKARMIQWDNEKKKLVALEKKLKALRSEDAVTTDALADIEKDLA